MRLGFRGRLLLGTTLLVVAFVATAVSVLGLLTDDYADRQIAQKAGEAQASFSTQMELRRAALRDETRFLARSTLLLATAGIPGVDQATFEDPFDEIQGNFSAPLVAVLDPEGRVVASRGAHWRRGDDLRGRPGVEAALAGRASDHAWPHTAGLALVALAPLVQGDLLLGVLVRGEPLDANSADRISRIAGRDVLLVHEGRLLGEHWLHEAPEAADLGPLLALRHAALPDGGAAVTLPCSAGPRRGLAVRVHPDAGIAFLSHDLTALLALQQHAQAWLLGAGAVLVLLGVVFATRMAMRLSRPLRTLIRAADRMGTGDLAIRVDGRAMDDELGRLAASFNAMATTVQSLVADVTDKAARAEAGNRAKDAFLASMSHELRTPLTGIQSTAELLQQYGKDASPAERDEFLATILREAERLGRRITDALEFANLAGGKTQWTLGRVDLVRVCEQACRRLDGLQPLKAVEFTIAGGDAAVLQGDRERLTQAVQQLVHNAWVWSPPGAVVDVAVRAVDDGFVVEVADRGPGIPAHEREAIFDYFTQGGDLLVDKPQGIGIGLKIASEIAEAHGGRIDYSDRPGGGAVFTLRLRRADRPIDRLATPTAAAGTTSA